MKGLLHRLAARAAGTMVAVRSDSRLPFGGAGLGRGAADAVVEKSLAMDVGVPAPSTFAALVEPPDGSAIDAPKPMLVPSPQRLQKSPAKAGPSVAPKVQRDEHAHSSDVSTRNSHPTRPRLLDGTPAATGHASYRTEPTSEFTLRSGSSSASEALRSDVAARSVEEPSLLIPLAVSHGAVLSGMTPPATRRQPAAPNSHTVASTEPSEVHIHIGRVEVTAVHEPTARRRRSPTALPMSLETYLAKRGRV